MPKTPDRNAASWLAGGVSNLNKTEEEMDPHQRIIESSQDLEDKEENSL